MDLLQAGSDPRVVTVTSLAHHSGEIIFDDRPVRSLLAHPGFTATNLTSTGPTGMLKVTGALAKTLLFQNVERGVLPQLYAATAPHARGGELYGPDGWKESRGHPTTVRPSDAAQDPDTARRLWELSEELTGIRYALATPS